MSTYEDGFRDAVVVAAEHVEYAIDHPCSLEAIANKIRALTPPEPAKEPEPPRGGAVGEDTITMPRSVWNLMQMPCACGHDRKTCQRGSWPRAGAAGEEKP